MDDYNWNQQDAPDKNTDNSNIEEAPRYEHYQMHQRIAKVDKTPKHEKHFNKNGKKFATTVSLAVVFGLVAGIVFQGVNIISDKYIRKTSSTQIKTATLTTASDSDSSSASSSESTSGSTGTVAQVAQAAMPAVVAITTVSIQEIPSYYRAFGYGYGSQQYSSEGSGSGIIVGENDDELLIATNNHVVSGATTLSVCFIGNDVTSAEQETADMAESDTSDTSTSSDTSSDSSSDEAGESDSSDSSDSSDVSVEDAVSAKIKGTDESNDLAVIAVQKSDIPEDTLSRIKIATLGDSDSLEVGEQVVAIGNALGYGQSVTSGWISALNRTITTDNTTSSGLIQTDAAINPGNSGGALLNMKGEVIGINSAKYEDSAVEGMGYAIPISKASPILENLMNRQTRDKVDSSDAAYLGVSVADLSTEAVEMYNMPEGAFVTKVDGNSAAANAGIQKGDIIVSFDGQTISGKDSLDNMMEYYASGETVDVVVSRANNGEYEQQTFQVILGSRNSSENGF